MTATLTAFSQALLTPDVSFAQLADARPITEPNGLPRICRTTRFAEARIMWRGGHWLLFMPLSPSALLRAERLAAQIKPLNTSLLTEYRILRREMACMDFAGREQHIDLIIQRLPEGVSFAEALTSVQPETLSAALDTLERGLRKLGLSHNNLKSENLWWSNGRLIPLRYHDAAFEADGDAEAFTALRRQIGECAQQQILCDTTATYSASAQRPLTGHRWTSHLFEGVICVEDEAGFGYVDTQNRIVIPPQYLWAGDFREGRAEVQTSEGMGLIDRTGAYVIPPEYEIVDYDPTRSIVRVRLNGQWALFDILGRRLTEFHTTVEA